MIYGTLISKILAMENGSSCFFSYVGFLNFPILLIIGASTLLLFRILYVIYRSSKQLYNSPQGPLSTLIILGSGSKFLPFLVLNHLIVSYDCSHQSLVLICPFDPNLGGHTAEMLNLLGVLQMERFKPRCYIAAATDNMSLQKARVMEDTVKNKAEAGTICASDFLQIYRSREVGQSYITSVGTTLAALAHALWLMIKIRPRVILCNGPGTCIPLCAIAFVFKVLGIRWSSIFYVESIARVRRLSLSGLLLYKLRMADQVFVQWPQLKNKYPRANYVGRLM
ncbi:hypothetical protein SASPL_130211 [Salvia splendens]|uniref:UDP-N-acetylglucosamine transferase subunit ALG14 n=1 Tax=Salvia splendens TaxID=180675 RepID=A0A8X8X7Q3_SALSN|nr:hypothetical protein SASPL_130211 [Salvia splendens]